MQLPAVFGVPDELRSVEPSCRGLNRIGRRRLADFINQESCNVFLEFFVDGASIGIDNDDSNGWSVSWDTTLDNDGDLATVELILRDPEGVTEDSATVDISGSSASGTTTLSAKFDENSQVTYEVELTVSDTAGNKAVATATEVKDGS